MEAVGKEGVKNLGFWGMEGSRGAGGLVIPFRGAVSRLVAGWDKLADKISPR